MKLAGRTRQRIESIEEARRLENGGEETDLTAVVFEPTAGRIAEQSCSPRDRHGGFLDGPRCGVRNPGLGVTDNFAEIGLGSAKKQFFRLSSKTVRPAGAIAVSLLLQLPLAGF